MDLLGFSSSGRADCRKQGTGAESRGDETIGDCFAGPSGQWSDLRTRAGMGEVQRQKERPMGIQELKINETL